MGDEGGPVTEDDLEASFEPDLEIIERAVLNDTEHGRSIQAGFVEDFGAFMVDVVRPILVEVAAAGGQPQLLVNGLAELMRSVADQIEFPLDHPRAGNPPTPS